MKVELERPDLINLCKEVARSRTGDLTNHKFKDAFEVRPYSNGPVYRFSEAWANSQTDEKLFDFYQYHSSTIKLL